MKKSLSHDDDPDASKDSKSKARSIYTTKAQWKKLQIIKECLGSWNLFADVVCEQLLASGLVGADQQKAIEAINKEYGITWVDSSGLRDTFEIREPASRARTNIRKIEENLVKINGSLVLLGQSVEDHAMAMLDADLVQLASDSEDASEEEPLH